MVSETKLGACVFKVVKLQPSLKTSTAINACSKSRGKSRAAASRAGITFGPVRHRKGRKAKKSRKSKGRKGRKSGHKRRK